MADQAPSLAPPDRLASLPAVELQSVLDLLFEHSPLLLSIATKLLAATDDASTMTYPSLIDAVGSRLLDLQQSPDPADRTRLVEVLGAHPRLGEKKKETLSVLSAREQSQLQQSSTSTEEEDELARLNKEYEETFPGLRYVVFVNGRGRPEIFDDMRRRIARGNAQEEEREAIKVRSQKREK